jgi:hypothetical protein
MNNKEKELNKVINENLTKEAIDFIKRGENDLSDEYLKGWANGKQETKEKYKHHISNARKRVFEEVGKLQSNVHVDEDDLYMSIDDFEAFKDKLSQVFTEEFGENLLEKGK